MGVKAEGLLRVCEGESSNFCIPKIPTISFQYKIYSQSFPLRPVPSLMINSVRSDKGPTTRKKCFFVTCVTSAGMQTACFPPSIQSLQRYGNVHCVPLLAPYPAVPFNSSASPLPFFTLTLTKHHHGKKKSKPKSKKNQKKPKKT